MIDTTSSVSSVYVHVIEDVIAKCRDDFAAANTGDDVLNALQAIWETKMVQCGAIVTASLDRRQRAHAAPALMAPVHDLNVPYDGGFEEYQTPTAEMLFPPTPQMTPAQTPIPGMVQTPLPGTAQTPLPGNADHSMYNINTPTGLSHVNNARNAIDPRSGRPNPYMQPPSPWMSQRPLGLDVNVAYEDGHDETDRGASLQPLTQDFFMPSNGKRKRDDPNNPGGHIPQGDGSGDMTIEFHLSKANATRGTDVTATVITKEQRSMTQFAQQDGVNDDYNNFYHFQGVANEDYNTPAQHVELQAVTPAVGTPFVGTPFLGTPFNGTPIQAKTENIDDDEPPLNEDDDDDDDLDELEQGDEEPNTQHLVLAQFDKVTRTKSKWKCTLKSGIMHYNNRDVLFNKANGEFEF